MMLRPIAAAAAALFALNTFAAQGPSSSAAPYLVPTNPSVSFTSLITAGDTADNGYRMVGIPDGLGAYDNGNGTFTVLMNQELSPSAVLPNRAQGGNGAFVSEWVIDKTTLRVVSGADLMTSVKYLNSSTGAWTNGTTAAELSFTRFCSADLAAVTAFYNPATGLGTQSRIFLNGEETGTNIYTVGGVQTDRGLAHLATGASKGSTYVLPWATMPASQIGWENLLANPNSGDKTIVMGNSDGGKNGVWMYVGNKQATGNDVEKAGLVGGSMFRIAVNTGTANTETIAAAGGYGIGLTGTTTPSGSFSLISGDLAAPTGTTFLRPEDGAWDLNNKNVYYFVTTSSNLNAATPGTSRLWKMTFNDVTGNPTSGGKIEMLVDGTEGHEMFDNMTIDSNGNIVLQEDPGNNQRATGNGTARVWVYNPGSDSLTVLAEHDPLLFSSSNSALPSFLTRDEESSGVIEITSVLGRNDGKKYYLLDTQNHKLAVDPTIVEGGQLMIMAVPEPETNLMMLGGLGLLGLVARRRKSR